MNVPKGLTLIELMVVVIILGILAAAVVPQFGAATSDARQAVLRDQVRNLQGQCLLFRDQHGGVAPGYPGGDATADATEDDVVAHLTMATNERFETSDPGTEGYGLGPYLRRIPENPLNGKASIQVVAGEGDLPAPDGSHGWLYQPRTLRFASDAVSTDAPSAQAAGSGSP